MKIIFLVSGLIIGGLGVWAITSLGDSSNSSDQVLVASADGTETPPASTTTTTTDELPICVNSDGAVTEVVRPAIEHILHCRLIAL